MKLLIAIGLALCCWTQTATAAYTSDTGKITILFTDGGNNLAVQFDNAFPNAKSSGQCPTANGFAGIIGDYPLMKSTLLAAKAANQTVTLTIDGCEASGNWYKIINVYVQ